MTHRHTILRLAASLPLFFSFACTSTNDTSIVVHVVSDDSLALDSVDMSARSASSTAAKTVTVHFPDPRNVTWVLSPNGSDRMFMVQVDAMGMKNGSSVPVVAQRALVSFKQGMTVNLTMTLAQACVGVPCAAPLTCLRGTCVDPGTLQPPPGSDHDASMTADVGDARVDQPVDRLPDAGMDAVDVRPAAPDSGPPDVGSPDVLVPQAIGASCGADNQCASNHCVDGLCCNTACTGSCQQCDTTAMPGYCVAIAAGQPAPAKRASCSKDDVSTCKQTGFCDGHGACQLYANGQLCKAATCDPTANTLTESRCDGMGACVPGTALSCAPFRCKSGDTACARTCTTTADCDGQPCLTNSCGKLKGGAACNTDADCLLGFCVDGVCCDSRCGGQCQACNLSGTVGTCSSVKSGQPVGGRASCTGTGTCGGSCGGQSTCVYPATQVNCRPMSCDVSTLTSPANCNGTGACPTLVTSACPNHLRCQANATTCLSQCTTNADCVPGFFCSGTTCTATKTNGSVCATGTECTSGFCTDGVCCNVQCNGTCTTCGTGTCTQVKGADDNDTCTGANTCSSVATCLKKQGQPCSVTTDCAVGVCADGVCCNTTCTGQCESCSNGVTRGVCGAVTTPRTPCAGAGTTCLGHCDGTTRATCVYPGSTTSCGPANCSGQIGMLERFCAAGGVCPAATMVPCGGFGCNGTACASSCASGQGLCGGACVDVQSSPTHCGAGCAICGGTMPKCAAGTCVQCTVATDCAGAGSICTANHTCACRPKSATNMLVNPGFDSATLLSSSWAPSGGASFATDDADGCPGSGSVQTVVTMPAFDFGNFRQCVRITAPSYSFGFKYKAPANASGSCMLETFTNTTDCTSGTVNHVVGIGTPQFAPATDWTSIPNLPFQPVNGEQSVLIMCQTNTTGPAMFFDQIYLNTAGATF
ncbi:MAG TPA: hypothetical protein VFH68_22380 [Polyangia bacterium]|nr:hypothetical protein [Polyangia bacterium]